VNTPRLARLVLALIGVAAVAGTWLAMLTPDDLQSLPGEPADMRLGPRAADAGRRCRQELLATQPGLAVTAIALSSIGPVAGDRDATLLQVEGRFREPQAVGEARVMRFRCLVSATGLRSLAVEPAAP